MQLDADRERERERERERDFMRIYSIASSIDHEAESSMGGESLLRTFFHDEGSSWGSPGSLSSPAAAKSNDLPTR